MPAPLNVAEQEAVAREATSTDGVEVDPGGTTSIAVSTCEGPGRRASSLSSWALR